MEYVFLGRELGGRPEGPVTIGELRQRYGTGDFRVCAYNVREQRMLWKVYATIRRAASDAAEPG